MKLVLTFCIAFIIAISFFALYFCCVVGVFPFTKTITEFSGMFQPLEALFTALAFFALVITAWAQAKELRRTKRETAEALVVASRLQAAGARLISMAVEKD